MGNRWVPVLDRWLHLSGGCWRLHRLDLGCNKEVAALLRWLLTHCTGYTSGCYSNLPYSTG